jgi:hypothetical protein
MRQRILELEPPEAGAGEKNVITLKSPAKRTIKVMYGLFCPDNNRTSQTQRKLNRYMT